MSTTRVYDANNPDDIEAFEAIGQPAPPAGNDVPDWVNEGIGVDDLDDDPIPGGEDISKAKAQEKRTDVIPSAPGVRVTIEKAVLDKRTPQGEDVWRTAQINFWLKITDGIVYKKGEKPQFKGKMFFHRVNVAVNRKAEAEGVYDFSVNKDGQPTDYYQPDGKFFGEYNEMLQAVGHVGPTPQLSKAYLESLKGKTLLIDIERETLKQFDKSKGKEVYIKGEWMNKLYNARPDKASKAAPPAAVPAAVAASADTPAWEE
jgi:hypothetical protein